MIKTTVIMICILIVNIAFADTFSFTDDEGTMHFVDDPSLIPKKYQNKTKHDKEASSTRYNEPAAGSENTRQLSAQIDPDTVYVCHDSNTMNNYKNRDFVRYLSEMKIKHAVVNTQKNKYNRLLCTQLWCNDFLIKSSAYANELGVDEENCVAKKLKNAPLPPEFFVIDDIFSEVLNPDYLGRYKR